jgi:hypothetical protein
MLDLDADGICELVDYRGKIYRFAAGKGWQPLSFDAPIKEGIQFLDLNGDAKLDLVCSDVSTFSVHVFDDLKTGWRKVRAGKAGAEGAIPIITRSGSNNGCFVHSGHLWWANEDTHLLKNFVDRRSFEQILGK